MFMDQKNQYSENEYNTQSSLYIQCNPYQATKCIFHRTRTNNFTICIETQLSSDQSLRWVQLFATRWTAAHQASLSITNSQNLLKLMSTESVMPSNHLILCCPLLLPPSIFPSIRVFSNESVPCIRWPNY